MILFVCLWSSGVGVFFIMAAIAAAFIFTISWPALR
jgi:hypothetical protein